MAIAVDSGGMHLANCVAVPTVALFGPTNPLEMEPFYAAPKVIVRAPNCPVGGALPMDLIPVSSVIDGVQRLVADDAALASAGARF